MKIVPLILILNSLYYKINRALKHGVYNTSYALCTFRQMEDPPLKSLKFLSQSTDSLHKTSKVSESTESLTDEGKSLHFILESLPIYTNQV